MNYAGKFDAKLPIDGSGLLSPGNDHVETITHHGTHAPADAIIVPDPQLLFNGDFKRSGVDLILSKDSHELVLHDYFKGEKRAPLASPDGAHLTGDLVDALTGHTQVAQADGSASVGKVIGHVSKLVGTATAIRNGVSIILHQGDNVEKGDVVQSGSDSSLGITFIDGTVFGLLSNARMVLNEMVYDPNGSNNSSLLSLVAGTITFVAGETAKHGDMKIDTPVATMGIRGTAVLVEIDFQIPAVGPSPNQSQELAPRVSFQVLVESDGKTGSFFGYEKGTLTKIFEVDNAGVRYVVSQGIVSKTDAPLLSDDVQKLIKDVFTLKFSDANPKIFDHFTDTIIPQSLQPIKLADGTTATVVVLVKTADTAPPSGPGGQIGPLPHIPGPPQAVAFGNSFTELVGKTGDAADVDTVSGNVNYLDVNAGDIPTVKTAFTSFTYQNALHNDVTATLNAQQLADIKALEVNLAMTQDPAGKNAGSATWTYSIADRAFDFLAAGEKVILTYTAEVDNNFAPLNEAAFPTFTITITGTNDAPTITATSAAVAEHSAIIDHAGGTITFADVDLTDRPVVSTAFSSFTYRDSHGNDVPLTVGLQAEIAAVEASLKLTPSLNNANNGSVAWSYDVADSNLSFLSDGDTLTLTYLASVDDGHGGLTSTPITVTLIGVSDVPHLITELGGHTGDTADHDTASGALNFAGVDLSNIQSVIPSVVSATWSGGSVLPSGLASTLVSSLTASSTAFNFSAADNNFDFLADGETLAVIYDVTVTDIHGSSATRPVTIIITGTNDTPHITSGAQSAAIAELSNPSQPNPTGSTAADTAAGAVTFTDVDLSDTHTVTVTNVATSGITSGLPSAATMLGWISLGALTDSTGGATGSDAWSFSAQDRSFDYLAAGESVTLTYTVQVDDGHGGVTTQPVTIVVTGTNDTPVITSGAQSAAIAELSNPSQPNPTGSTAADTAAGAVTFTDVDLSDTHTVTVTNVATSGITSGLPSAATMLGWISLGALTDSTGGATGSDAWSFSAQDRSFDYLAAGESVTLTYTVQVDDGHGGVTTQPVTIVVTGTNDTPVITSGAQNAAIAELSNPSQPNPTGSTAADTASGAVTFTDVDLSDTHTVTVTNVATSGITSGLPSAATMLGWISLGALTDSTGGATGSDAWSFSAQDRSFDYLAAGESVTLTYTVQVDDGHGGVTTQPVTIVVTGTNDTPVITSGAQNAAIAELSNPSQPNPTGSTAADTATGAVTFTDVDLSDTHTVTVTNVATSGITSGLPSAATMLGWISLGALTDSTGGATGSDAWSFSAQDRSFDYLAAGESVTLTYTVQVDDGHGGVTTQPVTIVVTGTNDTPVITSGAQNAAIAELSNPSQPNPTGSTAADTASGAVTFTDVDLSDTHTVTVTNVATSGITSGLPSAATMLGWISLGALTDSTGGATGSDAWSFSAQDRSFDYLAVGESVTLTYTVQVDDGHGGVTTQPVTIVVTGTNDTPVITSGAQSAAIAELSNPSQPNPTGSTAADTASGAVTFTDVDLSDTHTVTVTNVATSGITSGLPSAATMLGWISLGALTDSTGGATGSDAWSFSAQDRSFDYLAAGESVTLTYTVQVDDGHGGVTTQPVTIVVTGTNDTPVITSGAQSAAIAELSNPSQPNPTGSTAADTATGAVTFTDVDLSDTHTVTVTNVATSGITSGLPSAATMLGWISLGALTDSTGGATGSDAWSFSAQDRSFDYLAAGESVTLTYTVQVDDGHGGVTTQPVTIVVTGTNDTPHITSGAQSAAIAERSNPSQPNPTGSTAADTASGAVTFTDVDLSDTHTVTVTNVATSGITSGLPSAATMLGWISLGALTDSTGGATGSDAWSFSAQDRSFDYLAAGESVTLTYTVQVDDGHGGVTTQPVTIVVTGTNDTPHITSGAQSAAIAERSNPSQPNPTGSTAADTASGAVTFTDVDLSDTHTVTVTNVATSGITSGLPSAATMLGWISLGALTDSTGGATGSDAWSFSAQDRSFDYLAAGESVTLTYTVQVDDGHGGVTTQPVTIVVTGTNDTPVITSGAQSAAIAELSNPSQPNPTGSTAADTATGAVTFTDVDLSDTHTVTVTNVATSGITSGLPSAATMLGWISLGALTDSTGGATGSDAWSFSAQDRSFDYLAAGESVTLTYTVQVDDGHGGVTTQPVTIVVTGTNDTPHITSGAQSAAIAERSNPSQPNPTGSTAADTASGAVTFTDVDLSDTHTVTVTNVATSGITSGLPSAATMLGWISLGALTDSTGGATGSDAWSFSAQDRSFDYLAVGESVTLTYTVQVDDGHGGVTTQPVTIVVTGTNDTPHITSGAQSAAIAERSNPSQPNPTGSTAADTASGAVTFTDVDLSDTHTVTVTNVATSGITSGLPSAATMLGWISLGALTDSTGGATGSDAWSFSAQDRSFDYLAVGESVTLTYTVQVDDGHGGVTTQPVTIVVTGTNDTPVITSGAQSAAIAERSNPSQPNPTGSTAADTATGAVTFTDVDLSDTHTVTVTNVATSGITSGLPSAATMLGWISLGALTDSTGGATGSDAWSFSAQDRSFDYLAVGQSVTLTYTVKVADTHGGTTSQNVVVTVTGTNDSPTILAGSTTATGAFTHGAHGDGAPESVAGSIAFADADLIDVHTVSQATPIFALSSGTLTNSQKAVLAGASALTLTKTDSTGTGSGSVAWNYSLGDSGSDLLAPGQKLTVTYAVTIADGHGGSTSQNVVVTVTGTTDIDPAGVAGSAINLGLTQVTGVGSMAATVTGFPLNWTMAGATHNADGSWTAQTNDFSTLAITPDVNFVGATVLNVIETWTNSDGSAGSMAASDNVESYAPGSPIFAVAGDDHLTGTGSGNLFVFAQPIGNDIVYNFNATSDKIDLIGFNNIASFADIQGNIADDANGNAVINIGANETITLNGVHAASVTASDFVFNQAPITENPGTMQIGDGAHLSLSGTINNTGTIELISAGDETALQLIEHGITLAGAGHVVLSDSVENSISGTSADVTLTNVDNTISGAGQIGAGQLTLINEGTIDATGANSLTIDTGVNVVTNTGTLEATGSGGLTVVSAIANSGILWANGATLTAQGEVTGNGIAKIDGIGTADFEASSTANVVFGSGAAGTLKLGDSFHFNGTISGFAGSDIIDLANVGSATMSISYHENAAGTGGTLEISDGAQTVGLSLLGHYATDNFSIVPDHAHGTLVTYVPHDLVV